ncbi:MAG TPA: tRNA dihydrouridine synthase DusB [Planctomycetaceae bacterium]|nr:tRNA dihydrouridine synthase DusB [Planctomycetaceae bacterium]
MTPTNRLKNMTVEESSHTIRIGGRLLASRYFLAPLAGYTHLAFRTAMRELGGLGLATTDLVLATHLVSESRKSKELIATTPADRPLTVQIFSGVTSQLVEAARFLQDRGYEAIDINMGCPMARINSQGGGARMMCDATEAARVVEAVVEAVDLPVSVKMRLGWDRESITAPELAREFEKIGVAAVTVHGRTRAQGFHGTVDLDAIKAVKEAVREIPVIGNGDVRSIEDAIAMRERTGCDAVAIGRGAMLDPWIFRNLERVVARGEAPLEPTPEEQLSFLVRHFTLMYEQHEEYSCVLFRKFASWYGAKLGIPEDLEARLQTFESVEEFNEIVAQIRERHGERESFTPTALIRVPNGPVEKW